MKARILIALFVLRVASPLMGQTADQVIDSLGLLELRADQVREYVSGKLLPGLDPEYSGKSAIDYFRGREGQQAKLQVSHKDGKVTGVSWWFDGDALPAPKLAELQKAIEMGLHRAGFVIIQTSASVGPTTLFGDAVIKPSKDAVLIATVFAKKDTNTVVEFYLELPTQESKVKEPATLWVSLRPNAYLGATIYHD